MWSRGTVLGGRYTLVERIGGGAMGEVWRAEDQVLERRVAVKIVLPALLDDADFALRFRREARILASLSHPSIVDIHDYGEDDDQPDDRLAYIVMELVDGRPLDAIRAERGRLPAEEALDLVAQALEALQVAHEREIVHRDIKPSNLMVTTGGLVKVTDFGIARALAGTKITTSHSVFGTALYMAPEQAEGQGTVAASDLYSIGVVAYELLTGELPFTGGTVLEIVLKHVREPAPALPEEFPEPVRAFVARALAKSPGDRHPTAAAMAVAARRAAEGLPDLTPPPVAAAPVAVPPVAAAAGDSADEAADEVSEDGQLAPTEPAKALAGGAEAPAAARTPTEPATPVADGPTPVGGDTGSTEISNQPTVLGAPQPVWWKRRRRTTLILVPCVIVASAGIGVVLNLDESPHTTALLPGAQPVASASRSGGAGGSGSSSASASNSESNSASAAASASGTSAGSPSAAASGGAPASPGQNGGGPQPNPAPNGGAPAPNGGAPAGGGGNSGGGNSGSGNAGGAPAGGGSSGAGKGGASAGSGSGPGGGAGGSGGSAGSGSTPAAAATRAAAATPVGAAARVGAATRAAVVATRPRPAAAAAPGATSSTSPTVSSWASPAA